MLNQGVSFGLFQGIPIWIVLIIWLGLFLYAVKMRELWGRVGLGLMLVGGAGNIVSRIIYGGVVDNLSLFGLLYNNIWDYLIFIGLIIFIWKNYFLHHD
jgi:lipoprotein signal peptidase